MHNKVIHLADGCPAHPWSAIIISWPALPSLYAEHDILWCGIPHGPIWVSCPGHAPPSFLRIFLLAEHGKMKSS